VLLIAPAPEWQGKVCADRASASIRLDVDYAEMSENF